MYLSQRNHQLSPLSNREIKGCDYSKIQACASIISIFGKLSFRQTVRSAKRPFGKSQNVMQSSQILYTFVLRVAKLLTELMRVIKEPRVCMRVC
jgi:hypothetical protein